MWLPIEWRGVGNKEESGPFVLRPDRASRNNSRPEGVPDSLQIVCGPVDPFKRIVNLLTKDAARVLLSNEFEPSRPKVAAALKACLLSAE